MTCINLDWQRGTKWYLAVGDVMVKVNYFTCGKYYFNGMYNVVRFEEGVTFFHGSLALAKSYVEMPVGKEFYQPVDGPPFDLFDEMKDNNKSQQEILSQKMTSNIQPMWGSNYSVASKYAQNFNRVGAYKTFKPVELLVLDDDYNIAKFLFSKETPYDIKKIIMKIFSLTDDINISLSRTEFGKIQLDETKYRVSIREWDIPLANYLKEIGVAGYACNFQNIGLMHGEVLFTNPFQYLKRDLGDKDDWQSTIKIPNYLQEYFNQQDLYKTTCIDLHSGNLLDETIWTMFYNFQLVRKLSVIFGLPESKLDLQSTQLGCLYNIGQMLHSYCYKRDHDLLYHTYFENYNENSYNILLGKLDLHILDENMQINGVLDISQLFHSLNIKPQKIPEISNIIKDHTIFQQLLPQFVENNNLVVDKYISMIGNKPLEYYVSLLSLSFAVVQSLQPCTTLDLLETLKENGNIISIKNRPKLFRGPKYPYNHCICLSFVLKILNKIYKTEPFNFIDEKLSETMYGENGELLSINQYLGNFNTLPKYNYYFVDEDDFITQNAEAQKLKEIFDGNPNGKIAIQKEIDKKVEEIADLQEQLQYECRGKNENENQTEQEDVEDIIQSINDIEDEIKNMT